MWGKLLIRNIFKQVGGRNQPDMGSEVFVKFFFGIGKPVNIQTIGDENPHIEGEIIDFLFLACNKTNFHLQGEVIMNLYIFIYHTWIL